MVVKYTVGHFPQPPGFIVPRRAIEYLNMKAEIEALKARIKELEGECSEGGDIMIKDMTREEAKREIEKLLRSGRTLYFSDIADELALDLEMVVDICDELLKEGKIGIDEDALARK